MFCYFTGDIIRTDFLDELLELIADIISGLIRNKSRGNFTTRPRRYNRLAALTLIAAGNAIDIQRRS